MRSKRFGLVGGFLILVITAVIIILNQNPVHAGTLCADDQIILRLSSATNAHGEVYNGAGDYPVEICYDQIFGVTGNGDRTCSGTNKVLGLSSATNAHGEEPSQNNYATDVCYGGVQCVQRTGACQSGESLVVSLSSVTNAHLASDSSYTTSICCSIGIPTCELTNAFWNTSDGSSEVFEGTSVDLIVEGNNCDGEIVSFIVMEDDTIGDDNVTNNPSSVTFSGNTARGTWTAEYQNDGFGGGDPEYYFLASAGSEQIQSNDPLLTVKEVDVAYCSPVSICGNYYTHSDPSQPTAEEGCNVDLCGVAEFSVESIEGNTTFCDSGDISCICGWDSNTTSCNAIWEATSDDETTSHAECINNQCVEVAGDGVNECGVIGSNCNLPPEFHAECVGLSCLAVSGAGSNECSGSAECVGEIPTHAECINNQCVEVAGDGVNECGVINQSCNPPVDPWHAECIGLSCIAVSGSGSNECSGSAECADGGPGGDGAKIGKCVYEEETTDTCDDDGFLTFSWTAEWFWEEGKGPADDPEGLHLQCQPGQRTVECPAQIPLPFFGFYNAVIALLAIGMIYWILSLGRKKSSQTNL